VIFDDEFDELAALAYQTAFRILGSRAEAQEVAQDTMIKAYLRWRKVQRHARPWVCRVAVNASLGIVRRRRRPHTIEEPRSSFQTEVADRVDLQRLLGSLSGRQRDVVVLRYLADMSEADVADELGISVGTVKTHASRGVEALRHHLASDKQPESDLDDRKEHTDV
jgi:RNA polymerase sigma factor (sigma-70 family)